MVRLLRTLLLLVLFVCQFPSVAFADWPMVATGSLTPQNNQISVTLTDITAYAAFNLVFYR